MNEEEDVGGGRWMETWFYKKKVYRKCVRISQILTQGWKTVETMRLMVSAVIHCCYLLNISSGYGKLISQHNFQSRNLHLDFRNILGFSSFTVKDGCTLWCSLDSQSCYRVIQSALPTVFGSQSQIGLLSPTANNANNNLESPVRRGSWDVTGMRSTC